MLHSEYFYVQKTMIRKRFSFFYKLYVHFTVFYLSTWLMTEFIRLKINRDRNFDRSMSKRFFLETRVESISTTITLLVYKSLEILKFEGCGA